MDKDSFYLVTLFWNAALSDGVNFFPRLSYFPFPFSLKLNSVLRWKPDHQSMWEMFGWNTSQQSQFSDNHNLDFFFFPPGEICGGKKCKKKFATHHQIVNSWRDMSNNLASTVQEEHVLCSKTELAATRDRDSWR